MVRGHEKAGVSRFALAVLTLTASLFAASPARAAPELPSRNDPAFQAAVQLWLDDDDARALPALARLAHAGNRAARLLLSRIEVTDRAPSPFVWRLSQSDRFRLFRADAPGNSPFRPSWIARLAKSGDSYAAALHASLAQGINLPAVRALYALNETQAAEHLVRKVAVDGTPAERREVLAIIGEQSELVPYVTGFMASKPGVAAGRQTLARVLGRPVTANDAATDLAVKYVEFGFQTGTREMTFSDKNRYFEAIGRWAISAPETRIISAVCRSYCPTEAARLACAATALGLLGGYHEVIRFDSPLESVIAQSTFVVSTRARNMVRRRLAGARTEEGYPVMAGEDLSARSACLAAAAQGMAAEPG